jgi:hypothetical protein
MPLHPDSWPDLLLPISDGVQVTVEVRSSVEEIEGYSACRSLVSLGYLLVLDLLSFLYYSTVGTSLEVVPHVRGHL